MRSLRAVRPLTSVALAGALLLGGAGAAQAGPPRDAKCYPNDGRVQVCYVPRSDNFWVKDTRGDGRSAVAVIRDRASNLKICRNFTGVGTWRMCNYDFPEYVRGRRNLLVWDNHTFDGHTHRWYLSSGQYSSLA